MIKQSNFLALGAVVLVAVVLLSLPVRVTSRLKVAVGAWFLPLFGLATAGQQVPGDFADQILPRQELIHQLNDLRRENQRLKAETIQTAAALRENDRLHALFAWRQQSPWRLQLASVIQRDPANWWLTVRIDRGSAHGLTPNLPILSTDGSLVGRVTSVGLYDAQVVLIGDRNCRVSALVENPTRDIGVIIKADKAMDTSLVDLAYLGSNTSLKPGQTVVTSGLGGVFPRGIPIGHVADAWSAENGLDTEARVKLDANLGSLEQVWVLFPGP